MCKNHCNNTKYNAELSPNSRMLPGTQPSRPLFRLLLLHDHASRDEHRTIQWWMRHVQRGVEGQSSTGPTVLQYHGPGKVNSFSMFFFSLLFGCGLEVEAWLKS